MNLNSLAVKIAGREGGKEQVNIAQIKEILKIVLSELSKMDLMELAKTLARR
jgi:hypothetical protein